MEYGIKVRSFSTSMSAPTLRTGKICYLEIPAEDIPEAAEFYHRAFGWTIRQNGSGRAAFDDTVNEVSGAWVSGRPPMSEPGLIVYIMVASAEKAAQTVRAAGGEIVKQSGANEREVWFTFRDPAGNVMGVYQQPGLEEAEAQGAS
ncbi:MAG: VOC family protein [Chloroflexota bacterium]